jgi:hypothetical protein
MLDPTHLAVDVRATPPHADHLIAHGFKLERGEVVDRQSAAELADGVHGVADAFQLRRL